MKKVIVGVFILSVLGVAEETHALQDSVDKLFGQGKYAPTAEEIAKKKTQEASQPKKEGKSLQSWIDKALGQGDAKKSAESAPKKAVVNDPSKTSLQNWIDNNINN